MFGSRWEVRTMVGVRWGVAAENTEFLGLDQTDHQCSGQEGKYRPSQPRERSAHGRPSADGGCSLAWTTHTFRGRNPPETPKHRRKGFLTDPTVRSLRAGPSLAFPLPSFPGALRLPSYQPSVSFFHSFIHSLIIILRPSGASDRPSV